MPSAISSAHCPLRLSRDNETLWTILPTPLLSSCSSLRDTNPNGVPGGRHPYTINVVPTLPFYFMQRARWDMCHYFRATIFLVTNGTCDGPLLERAARIIHVAFVFVKTLTKRWRPTWRPFNLHSRCLVWDNLVYSRRCDPLSFIATCCSHKCQKVLDYRYYIIFVARSQKYA